MLNKLKAFLILGTTFALTLLCPGVTLIFCGIAENSWIIHVSYVMGAFIVMLISFALFYTAASTVIHFALTFENYSRIERFIDWVIPDR
jgi:hypothetical protein